MDMTTAALLISFALGAEPVAAVNLAPDTAVVCPRSFAPALEPWLRHRRRQGHRIALIDNRLSASELRTRIRRIAAQGQLKFIVLVGDADPRAKHDQELRKVSTPTHLAQAKINIHWGSEPLIATDNWFADLDDDEAPDVSVGRLPADSVEELAEMVRKILLYEQQAPGPWCRRLSFVAGVGGFGALADTVLETATKRFLTSGVPSAYETRMTYGSWRSPYCPDPRRFHETALQRFNEGCLFWVYIGHGQRWYLDRVRVPGHSYHIFDTRDVDKLQATRGFPIAVFLACYTGAFDDAKDCLAEEMLRSRHGPVAVLCGSRVTMPYAMAVLGNGLMTEYFTNRRETLGETVLHAKREMLSADATNENRQLLDAVAKAISPLRDRLQEERQEHLSLFNLLGDPLLRLPHPDPLDLQIDRNIEAGGAITVRGHAPLGGELTVELAAPRDRLRLPIPPRPRYQESDEALATLQQVYEQAIDSCWTSQSTRVAEGEFQQQILVPQDARGYCHVRAIIQGSARIALGSAEVFVSRPKNN